MFGAAKLTGFLANPVAAGYIGTGSSYFFGGYDGGAIDALQRTNKIWKFSLSAETNALLGSTLTGSYDSVAGFANGTYGVCAGGSVTDSQGQPVNTSRIIALSDDTNSVNTNLPTTRRNGRGGSSSTTGYVFVGMSNTGGTPSNDTLKYTYSGFTWATGSAVIGFSPARRDLGVHSNATKSVLSGGYSVSGTVTYNTVRELTFSSDTYAAASYTLNETRAAHAVTGNQDKWVSLGGFYNSSAALTLQVDSYTFASGTRTAATSLTYGCRMGDAAGDDTCGVFIPGGTKGGGTFAEANRKYKYSDDTYFTVANAIQSVSLDIPGAFHSTQAS